MHGQRRFEPSECGSPVDCCLPPAGRRQHLDFLPEGKKMQRISGGSPRRGGLHTVCCGFSGQGKESRARSNFAPTAGPARLPSPKNASDCPLPGGAARLGKRSGALWIRALPGCPTFHRNVGFRWVRARPFLNQKTSAPLWGPLAFGAGGRARTGTVSLPVDFESTTSTNSITPACGTLTSIIQPPGKCKQNFSFPGGLAVISPESPDSLPHPERPGCAPPPPRASASPARR